MKKMLFAFVLCVLMLGCVTTSTSMLRINPLTLDGQIKTKQEGLKAIVSEKNVHVTIRSATDTFSPEDRPGLVVSVKSTAGSFNFSPKNIQVFVDGNPHRVFTYDELVAEIKEREKEEKKKAETVKEAQSAAGGASDTNAQYKKSLNVAETKAQNALKELEAAGLQNVRCLPNKQYSGHITIGKIPIPSQPNNIKVIVTVNKETHEFLLDQVEVKE